jgi:hypothetical protein
MAHRLSRLAEADLDDIWFYLAKESGSIQRLGTTKHVGAGRAQKVESVMVTFHLSPGCLSPGCCLEPVLVLEQDRHLVDGHAHSQWVLAIFPITILDEPPVARHGKI